MSTTRFRNTEGSKTRHHPLVCVNLKTANTIDQRRKPMTKIKVDRHKSKTLIMSYTSLVIPVLRQMLGSRDLRSKPVQRQNETNRKRKESMNKLASLNVNNLLH